MAIRRPITVLVALLSALLFGFVGAPAQAAAGDVVTVSGTVTDSNGNPVPFAYVALTTFPGGGHAFAFTDNAGFYQFDYTMVADGEAGYVSTSTMGAQCDPVGVLSGPASLTVNCVVPIFEQITVSGVATTIDGSTPSTLFVTVRNADSTAYGSAAIGLDGAYSTQVRYPAGTTELYVIAPQGETVATLTGFANGDVLVGVDFTYDPPATWEPFPATITGKVTDKKGKPVAGALVEYGSGVEGNAEATATTAADGTYVLDVQTYWNEEEADGSDGFVVVDGVLVDFVANIHPESVTVVDYRIAKTPIFEPFVSDIDLRGDGYLVADLLRKVNKDGTAEWAACLDWACTGAEFGTKHAEYLGLSPVDPHVGSAFLVLRDTSGGAISWLRIEPDLAFAEQATFGTKHLLGSAYFDFQGDGPLDFVAWDSQGGQTTVWTWGAYDAADGVETIVVDGKLVAAEHLALQGTESEQLVLVTRSGKNYAVTLLETSTAEPMEVATGRGEPTVTYEDADGDQIFDIVVTFPDRNTHRHHQEQESRGPGKTCRFERCA